jgi:hypothetical protein
MRGSYNQHPAAFTQLATFSRQRLAGATFGAPVGIYPTDPDAIGVAFPTDSGIAANTRGRPLAASAAGDARLTWELTLPVESRSLARVRVAPPYEVKTLPATQAVVLDSDAGRASVEGLALGVWVMEHGYVQTAPTRMQYIANSGTGTAMTTRIIIPVRKRPSGLALQ